MFTIMALSAAMTMALELPGEAPFAFDNTTCPVFMAGIWLANSQQDVGRGGEQALWHVTEALVLNEGGKLELAFASGISGDEPVETKTFGAWTAAPGATENSCALTLAFEEGERRMSPVAVHAETRILVDGQAFTRIR